MVSWGELEAAVAVIVKVGEKVRGAWSSLLSIICVMRVRVKSAGAEEEDISDVVEVSELVDVVEVSDEVVEV